MKKVYTSTLLLGFLFPYLAVASIISPTELISGKTVAVKILEGSVDITNQYTISSSELSIISLAGKPMAMGTVAGGRHIVATHKTDPSKTETFTVTVAPGTAAKLLVESGSNQKGAISTLLTQSLKVKAIDSYNNAVIGVPVSFSSSSASAVITPSTQSTGPDGVAVVDYKLGSVQRLKA